MSATLVERIDEDLKAAQKNREQTTISTLRMLRAALHNEEIAKREPLKEADVVRILQREVKRRKEAILSYQAGGSAERVAQETAEQGVLERYLPEQMDKAAIEKTVQSVITELNAAGPQSFGPVMKRVMQELQGKADGRIVQEAVKRLLEPKETS